MAGLPISTWPTSQELPPNTRAQKLAKHRSAQLGRDALNDRTVVGRHTTRFEPVVDVAGSDVATDSRRQLGLSTGQRNGFLQGFFWGHAAVLLANLFASYMQRGLLQTHAKSFA